MVCCLQASGLLCVVVRPHPHHDAHDEVESYDDPPGLKESEDEQQYEGRGCEDVFHLVAFPTPLLEFQGKHRQFANQQETADGQQYEQDDHAEFAAFDPRLAAENQ